MINAQQLAEPFGLRPAFAASQIASALMRPEPRASRMMLPSKNS